MFHLSEGGGLRQTPGGAVAALGGAVAAPGGAVIAPVPISLFTFIARRLVLLDRPQISSLNLNRPGSVSAAHLLECLMWGGSSDCPGGGACPVGRILQTELERHTDRFYRIIAEVLIVF